MDYFTVTEDEATASDVETVIIYRTDAPISDVRNAIEKRLDGVRRDGRSRRTVDPDTGNLALVQVYSGPASSITVMHSNDPDSDDYRVEIQIKGDEDRVQELEQPLRETDDSLINY